YPGTVARRMVETARNSVNNPSSAMKALKDCDSENLAALVGTIGSKDCKQSWMIDFDTIRALAPNLLTVLALALPVRQEVVRTRRLNDDSTARLALDRVASVIANAHVKTA